MSHSGTPSVLPSKILLVDDHEENLLALEVILEGPGLALIKAGSGAEALRSVLRDDFAVILLDVSMPGMDGFEVARLIKQRDRSKHIPIIFLTAAGTDFDSIYRGYEVGAVDYILKPINPDVVKAKVAVFVELHRRGEEIRRQAELLREAEQRRREVELAEVRGASERRYRSLADAVPQLIWSARPDGRVAYFNQRWMDFTGLATPEPLGLGWESCLHPNDAERLLASFRVAHTRGEALRTECRLRSAHGSYRWYLGEILPEHDRTGALAGWLGTFTDVNEHKRTEDERKQVLLREQMARSEAEAALGRLEFLAEASNLLTRSLDAPGIARGLAELAVPRLCSWCVVDLVDGDGFVEHAAFMHANEELRPVGDELVARPPRDPAALDDASPGRRDAPELATAACDAEGLAALLGTDRADLVARLGAAAYLSVPLRARGDVLGAMTLVAEQGARPFGATDLALAVDLAQRAALAIDNARLYARAQQTVRMREEFLSIASHELRTPLSALELQLQSLLVQLRKHPLDVEKMTAKATIAQRQGERLNRLISEMLDVARIQAGRLEVDRERVDLGEIVREVAARFGDELERAESRIEIDIEEGVIGEWDRPRLDQVVTNLLQNAAKYGAGRPIQVRLALERPDTDAAPVARLTVTDQGIGISPADQRRIFGRFERAVSSREYGGMGVGLFIVDQILKAHGGTIAVHSAPSEGATFVVELPTSPPSALEERLPEDDGADDHVVFVTNPGATGLDTGGR